MNEELTLMQWLIFTPTQAQCVPAHLPLSVSEPQRTIHLIGDNTESAQKTGMKHYSSPTGERWSLIAVLQPNTPNGLRMVQ
jgi:hypothetical protein